MPVVEFSIAVFYATAFACSTIVMTATTHAFTEGLIERSRSKRGQSKVTSVFFGVVPISICMTGFVAVVYGALHLYLIW